MALAIISFFISAIPAAIIAAAIFFVGKRLGYQTLATVVAILGAYVTVFLLISPVLNWFIFKSTRTELNADPGSPPGIMRDIGLPAEHISDFCFEVSPLSVSPRADFDLPERDFIQWMSSQGWQAQEFRVESGRAKLVGSNVKESKTFNSRVYPLRVETRWEEHVVNHGYCVKAERGTSILRFIYDLETGRVYFEHYER
jgi:hypothetical protein